MSYRPDYIQACARVSRALGLSSDESRLLAVCGPELATGQVSARVPEPDVGVAVRMGWIADAGGHDSGLTAELVEAGYLAWRTRQGWSHDPDGRSPGTGRPLPSRQLWMTRHAVDAIGQAMHALFREGLEAVRAKAETGPPLLRTAYAERHAAGAAIDLDAFTAMLSELAAPSPEAAPAPMR